MPTIHGLLSYISDIDKLEAQNIASFLPSKSDLNIIENRLGNLLLYPQTIPETAEESLFDIAVLKEMLRLEPNSFYSSNLKKIYIPENIAQICPNLSKLAFIFIDALKPRNLTSLQLKSKNLGVKNLGTYIKPENISDECFLDVCIGKQKFHVLAGNIVIIPVSQQKIDIRLESNCNITEGKNEFMAEVIGGDIGIIIDLCQQN
ncbi:MAG: hypothetical protein Q7R97_03820 [Candidatus Daviesbacteria bacterium]|nr:hypothetical protein [Candidatus Daviesbacteria bacterium]